MEVELNGREIVYASKDGQLIFTGDVIQMRDGDVVNLKEERYEKVRREGLANVDMASMITYPAEGDEKTEIYAFTDITCGYCRKLHRHIEDYTQAGITVHYLAFRAAAPLPRRPRTCATSGATPTPPGSHRRQAQRPGVRRGTGGLRRRGRPGIPDGARFRRAWHPAIYTAEGAQLGGYVTPEQLNQRLGL